MDNEQARPRLSAAPPNLRDPLVARLIGPGQAFEVEDLIVGGSRRSVFRNAPRDLSSIFTAATGLGSRIMVVHDGIRVSYADAFARAAVLANVLASRFGLQPGASVAIVTANRLEWVISFIAVTAAGGIAALVNSRGAAEEIMRGIAVAGCTLAILDAERADLVAGEYPNPSFRRIVIGAPTSPLRPGRDADYAELARPDHAVAFAPRAMGPDDGAVILFTSGTTGFAKGALLSHGALAHAASLSRFMGALQDLRYEEEVGEKVPFDRRSMACPAVILSPMFHLSGMLPVVRAISLGGTIHIMAKWNADVVFDMIETEGLSRVAFVPTMLWDMLRSPRATPENLAAIRNLAYGGAPTSPELLAEIRRRMPHSLISNTYGQSENTGWACTLSGQPLLDNPQSCGWACPTVDVCVLRDDFTQSDVGEPGELWVRSASVMLAYVGDPEATSAALVDGWCATGDIGKVDEAGLFTILDRRKNMVISGGENIYCAEVERVLFDHPDVYEAIAYGVPDARLGERLVATVVLEREADISEEQIKAYCRKRLAIYKTPREIRITRDALPRTASGKIDRSTFIRQGHRAG